MIHIDDNVIPTSLPPVELPIPPSRIHSPLDDADIDNMDIVDIRARTQQNVAHFQIPFGPPGGFVEVRNVKLSNGVLNRIDEYPQVHDSMFQGTTYGAKYASIPAVVINFKDQAASTERLMVIHGEVVVISTKDGTYYPGKN